MHKPATTSAPINELLSSRWSPRAFDPDYRMSAEQITRLAEAARWSPSCFGEEPWFHIFCAKHADPVGWQRAFDALVAGNQLWAANAALLICAVAAQNFARNGKPNIHHLYDTGAASMALVLQADSMGLRAHQMAGFNAAKAAASFAVPDGHVCIAMIAVGKQAEAGALPENYAAMETGPRTRKPLGNNFFAGLWDAPLGKLGR